MDPSPRTRSYETKTTYDPDPLYYDDERRIKQTALIEDYDHQSLKAQSNQYHVDPGMVCLAFAMLKQIRTDLGSINVDFRASALAWVKSRVKVSCTCITLDHLSRILNLNPTKLRESLINTPFSLNALRAARRGGIDLQKVKVEAESKSEAEREGREEAEEEL